MPIADTYVPLKTQGNGTTVEFSFNFPIIAAANLRVYLELISTGEQTLQVMGTHYSVVFNDNTPGGTVTMVTAPSALYNVIRARAIPRTSTDTLTTAGGFQASVVQRAFEKMTAMVQDVYEIISRSVRLPLGSSLTVTLPTPEDGLAPVWDGTAGNMKNAPVDAGAVADAVTAAQAAQAAAEAAASVTLTMAQIQAANNPVGTIRTFGVSTNPATLLGFPSTWVAIAGKVIVGIDATQTEFDTLNETGGAKTHTLTEAELPTHYHFVVNDTPSGDVPSATNYLAGNTIEGGDEAADLTGVSSTANVCKTSSVGSGTAHNNLQPYIVKYVWERTE